MRIVGDATARQVWIDGRRLSPRRSQRVWNHSPDGFSWGYGGSGPAQLALAILLAAGVRPRRAVELHQAFKWEHIAPLPFGQAFAINVDVRAWADRVESGADTSDKLY